MSKGCGLVSKNTVIVLCALLVWTAAAFALAAFGAQAEDAPPVRAQSAAAARIDAPDSDYIVIGLSSLKASRAAAPKTAPVCGLISFEL